MIRGACVKTVGKRIEPWDASDCVSTSQTAAFSRPPPSDPPSPPGLPFLPLSASLLPPPF